MKIFVTGVAGQLGHDVMNELAKRGYEGVGSDLAPSYSGVQDGSAVTTMPYVSLDITDSAAGFGADMLITACPLCRYNLNMAGNGALPVYYFTELLAEALGVKEEVPEA